MGVLLVLSGYAVGRASQPAPAHVYEMRTYTANDGKMDAMHIALSRPYASGCSSVTT